MSIHDRLAEKARASGKKSAQFKKAAQNHANATWFFVILSAIVWYFSSWPWALIPIVVGTLTMLKSFSATIIASKLEKIEQNEIKEDKRLNGLISLQLAEQIIQEYGNILLNKSATSGMVSDVNKLPYPKEKIKEALIIGLKSTTDPEIHEKLKTGYIMLSDWQEGVGESDQGLDLSKEDLNGDLRKAAQKTVSMLEGYEKFAPIILAEMEKLKQELMELGLW